MSSPCAFQRVCGSSLRSIAANHPRSTHDSDVWTEVRGMKEERVCSIAYFSRNCKRRLNHIQFVLQFSHLPIIRLHSICAQISMHVGLRVGGREEFYQGEQTDHQESFEKDVGEGRQVDVLGSIAWNTCYKPSVRRLIYQANTHSHVPPSRDRSFSFGYCAFRRCELNRRQWKSQISRNGCVASCSVSRLSVLKLFT